MPNCVYLEQLIVYLLVEVWLTYTLPHLLYVFNITSWAEVDVKIHKGFYKFMKGEVESLRSSPEEFGCVQSIIIASGAIAG